MNPRNDTTWEVGNPVLHDSVGEKWDRKKIVGNIPF